MHLTVAFYILLVTSTDTRKSGTESSHITELRIPHYLAFFLTVLKLLPVLHVFPFPSRHTAMAEESPRIDGDFLCVLYHSHEGPPVFAADPARIQGVDV